MLFVSVTVTFGAFFWSASLAAKLHSVREDDKVSNINAANNHRVEELRRMLKAKGMLGATSQISNINQHIMDDLETPSSLGETFTKILEVNKAADLDMLHKSVAAALQHDYSIVRFKSPAWRVQTDFDGVEPPYLDQFKQVDATHGEYKPTDSIILISPTHSSVLQGMDWADDMGPSLLGFGKKAQRKMSLEQTAQSRAAKHLVVYAKFDACLYFAHALANTLPRVTTVLQGARDAGYKVSVVTPQGGRAFFSENTERMLNAMGVDLLLEAPSTPHQTALLSQVVTWSPYVRQLMRQELRRGLMGGIQAKDCSQHPPPSSGIFLSRRHGSNNGRWMEGSEHLEEEFKARGFEIKDNLRDIALQDLARDLYQNRCIIAGFAGGNLLNLIFLPDKAKLVEYNPERIYADRWLFVKSLGLDWVHSVPQQHYIDAASAKGLVDLAFKVGNDSPAVGTNSSDQLSS